MTITPPSTSFPGALPRILYGEKLPGHEAVNYPYPLSIINRPLDWLLKSGGYDPEATTFPGLYGPIVNAAAFGIVDGGDSTVALQDAAALAVTLDIPLYIPAGTYEVSAAFTSGFNLTVIGAGKLKTTLKRTANVVFVDITTFYNKFFNLSFDLDGGTYNSDGITIFGVSGNCEFNNCSFENIPSGGAAIAFTADQAQQFTAQNCRFRGISSSSIGIKQTGDDTIATQRNIYNCDAAGMRLFDVNYIRGMLVIASLGTDFSITSSSNLGLNVQACNFSGNVTLKGINMVFTGNRISGTVTLDSGLTFSTYAANYEGTLVDNSSSNSNLILAVAVIRAQSADINIVGGFRRSIDGWYTDNVPGTQSATEMTRSTGRYIMLRAGSIMGITLKLEASQVWTAGSMTAEVWTSTINTTTGVRTDSATGLTAVIDTSNRAFKVTTQAKDTDLFAAGTEVFVKLTSASFTPAGSVEAKATVEIED